MLLDREEAKSHATWSVSCIYWKNPKNSDLEPASVFKRENLSYFDHLTNYAIGAIFKPFDLFTNITFKHEHFYIRIKPI